MSSNPTGYGIRGAKVLTLFSLGGQRYDMHGVSDLNVERRESVDTFQPAGQEEEESDHTVQGWKVTYKTRKGRSVADQIIDVQDAQRAANLGRLPLTIMTQETFAGESRSYAYSEGDVTVKPLSFGNAKDAVEVSYELTLKRRRRVS